MKTKSPAPTYEGGAGFSKGTKTELFSLAVTNMVGEETFYESAHDRDNRFRSLVRTVTAKDPQWIAHFIPFLRNTANMRSASIVTAVEAAIVISGMRVQGIEVDASARRIIDSACSRADEPAEVLGYFLATYGRKIPMGIKRGVGDAANRLYNERSSLKYDGGSRGVRMGDVLELVHPKPENEFKSALFKHLIDKRHGHVDSVPEGLSTILANETLKGIPEDSRRALLKERGPETLADAGFTWEILSGWLPGGMDAEAWSAIIPSMGYMACLAEGTLVWMADGTVAPIEEVVARRLPVLSPSRPFDTSEVRYGASQVSRDRTMGDIVPVMPTDWLDAGVQPVITIETASGRSITTSLDHRWVKRRRDDRRESWEWTTTADLRVGDHLPIAVGVDAWGDVGDASEGYFVGLMLGDGGMTGTTPEFSKTATAEKTPILAFMEDFTAKFGCVFKAAGDGKWRITYPPVQNVNPIIDLLRKYEIWGLRDFRKQLPDRLSWSREGALGLLSGLIDTDGSVMLKENTNGTRHAVIEFTSTSRVLAEQVADLMLRVGIESTLTTRPLDDPSVLGDHEVHPNWPLQIVGVHKAASIKRAAETLSLRHMGKAARLWEAASMLPDTPQENVEQDRIVEIGSAFDAHAYCVTVPTSSTFVANGLITGNCLRNLRNFEQAAVDRDLLKVVRTKLADPEEVAKSRQFPYRFWSAYKNSGSVFFASAIEDALELSCANLPDFPGRTLVAIDTSASMEDKVSGRSDIARYEAAALFAAAVNARSKNCQVIAYGTNWEPVDTGVSILRTVETVHKGIGRVGHGTNTWPCVIAAFEKFGPFDRILAFTDMQDHPSRPQPIYAYRNSGDGGMEGTSGTLPNIPIYSWDLGGYAKANVNTNTPGQYLLGGFSDASFKLIPLLEAGQSESWPWIS